MQVVEVNFKIITYKDDNVNRVKIKFVTVKKECLLEKSAFRITATINAWERLTLEATQA